MIPEQRVAQRVTEKHSLKIPADVERLARAIADVEEDLLPVNCDAVVISSGATDKKPLIILNSERHHTRRRFTLAHELGHLFIPWHMGTFACNTAGAIRLGDDHYRATEAESNRFASELLLPSQWIATVATSGMSAGEMHKFIRSTAEVSTVAAALSLIQALSSGHAFVVTNHLGFVTYSATSPGSALDVPKQNIFLDVARFSKHANRYETIAGSTGETVHWWRYVEISTLPADLDGRTASEILKAMIASTVSSEIQRKHFTQSVAGIIGAANGTRRPASPEKLLGVLHQTFIQRPDLMPIVSHPDFDTFLAKKARDIVRRRNSSQ